MSFPASFQYAEGDSDDGPDMKLDEDADAYLHTAACPAYFGALLRSLEHAAATGDLGPLIEMRKKDGDSPILDGIASVRGTVDGPAGPLPTLNLWREGADRSKLIQFLLIHGGGWGRRTYSAWNIRLSKLILRHDLEITTLHYSLSPEAPPGLALDECFAVWRSLPDDRPILLAGESAGGNLAASLAVKIGKETTRLIDGVILFYPVIDLGNHDKYESWRTFAEGFGLDAKIMEMFIKAYVPNEEDRTDWRFSPARADVRAFPPALIIAAQFDILRDEAIAFARKLAEAGRPVRLRCVTGTIHAFLNREWQLSTEIVNEEIANFFRLIKK